MISDTSSLLTGTITEEYFEDDFRINSKVEEISSKKSLILNMKETNVGTSRRKSSRASKPPNHLIESITDANAVGETIHNRILKTSSEKLSKSIPRSRNNVKPRAAPARMVNIYADFKCDQCGSRYVVNPMRRGNKVSTSKYKVAPRHKIDPETQKILTLCNACGLRFNRQKKEKPVKDVLSAEDIKSIQEQDKCFAKDLSMKLGNDTALRLYCPNISKSACRCVQKFICGEDDSDIDTTLERAMILLEMALTADKLKKLKCYNIDESNKSTKVGLGNGHRKSQEFEDFVLTKREELRNELKLCEKGTQKILSYSNNFLHKRMKTDPTKGYRIERQKGKAAMGSLRKIDDLPLESCCVDNCVRIALTHGRLLQAWRDRASASQVEARRVLAEMLTPSGGNRANCYRFITWVTGCSSTTIGKVNDQMKFTGGDREPPEHGLKKYWKDNPKKKPGHDIDICKDFVPSYEILKTAANSAGIPKIIQGKNETNPSKKRKRVKSTRKPQKKAENNSPLQPSAIVTNENLQTNQNLNTVIALYGNYQNGSFISFPSGMNPSSTLSLPEGVSLQTVHEQLQQQQQLQLQIQLLQQQLQNTQSSIPQATLHGSQEGTEYMVAVSTPIDRSNIVQNTPVVVQTVNAQPVIPQNVVSQSIVPHVVSNGVLPTLVAPAGTGGVNFVSSTQDIRMVQSQEHNNNSAQRGNISLIAAPLANNEEINLLSQADSRRNLLTQQDVDNSRRSLDNARLVHIVTSQTPTMAISQPVTISLQTPSIALPNLPTMLLAQPSANDQSLIIHPSSNGISQRERILIQPTLTNQSTPNDHVLVHHRTIPSVRSNTEQPVSITSSLLPPMTSFNTDVFLSSNSATGSSYSVFNHDA